MEDENEQKWKEVWKLYDLDKDDKLSRADFYAAVRVCGRRYTNDQLADKTKSFGEVISYDTFFGFMCDPYTGPTPDDLRNALRAFDGKDCGEITTAQLSSMLTTMGDKMTPEQIKPIMDAVPANQGKVGIPELVDFLTPPIPNANPNVPELMKELMREELNKSGIPAYEAPPPAPVAAEEPAAAPAEAPVEIPDAEVVESEAGTSSDEL
jgi:Ca2+-binding EF-hand superfamily protein